MKNGNLYQEVKSAKRDEKVAWAKNYALKLEMLKEMEEVTKPIRDKYEPMLKELKNDASEKCGRAWHVARIFHDYGSFSSRYIIEVFAVLLSYIEGEKYVPYLNFENHDITEGSLIIKESVSKEIDKIDYDILEKLYQNGDLIRLSKGLSSEVDLYNYVGEPNYQFGQFNYLREFTNRLIQYRIDNDKKRDMSEEELYSFTGNFILTHSDLAMKNKDKREQLLMKNNTEEYKKLEKNLINSIKM